MIRVHGRSRAGVFLVRLRSVLMGYVPDQHDLDYDWLAQSFIDLLLMREDDLSVECVAVFTSDGDVQVVPNRHEDPANNVQVHRSDVRAALRSGLVGFMHTHPEHCIIGVSPQDFALLPRGQTGAVWRVGSKWVDFHDRQRIIYSARVVP